MYINLSDKQICRTKSKSLWHAVFFNIYLWVIIIIFIKKIGSARLGESDINPISPKTPAPQYQPIDRKQKKGKRVEDYSRDREA